MNGIIQIQFQVKKLSIKQTVILDPSFFAYESALLSFIKSTLSEEYRVVIPTQLFEAIRGEHYDDFAKLSIQWEGQLPRRLNEAWSEIGSLGDQFLKTFIPARKVLEELTPKERELFLRIDKAITPSQRNSEIGEMVIEVAKEIVLTSCVASPVFSVSEKAEKWYNELNSTIVKKMEENKTIMKFKEDNRERIRKAGWKGSFLVWIAKHLPIPIPNYGDVVDAVGVVFVDGTYRCQVCDKSLYKLPRDIKFCPYCSTPLP